MKDLLGVEPSILGQKIIHKGLLYKGIQSSVTIPAGIFGIRITSKDDKFCLVEVITAGIDEPLKFNVYSRPKINVIKEVKEKKENAQLQEYEEMGETSLY